MAQTIGNGDHQERETFHQFFEHWLAEQNHHLQELVSAAKSREDPPTNSKQAAAADNMHDDQYLRSLVDRVVGGYEHYYQAKSSWAKRDVLSMFTPSWLSTLEDAFLWIGGWRPSMAFHLLYSKSGLQLEANLVEFIHGLRTGDLADLSSLQLGQIDELQRTTIRDENIITEKMAKHQESMADTSMVELSNVLSELIRNEQGDAANANANAIHPGGGAEMEAANARVEVALEPKKERLEEILQRADDLRLWTLKEVLHILTPMQAVYFLIAAAELHLRIHDWGKMHDAEAASHGSGVNGTAHHGGGIEGVENHS